MNGELSANQIKHNLLRKRPQRLLFLQNVIKQIFVIASILNDKNCWEITILVSTIAHPAIVDDLQVLVFGTFDRFFGKIGANVMGNSSLFPLVRQVTSFTATEVKHAEVLSFGILIDEDRFYVVVKRF